MKAITVNELARLCARQKKLGNGNKLILMTSDDEGNEYHQAWFGMEDGKEYKGYIESYQLLGTESKDLNDYVILS